MSTTSTAPVAEQAPRHRSVVGGVLPFIGVILFAIATMQQLASHPGPHWGPVLVSNAVTYLIGWAMVGAGIAHIFFGKKISRTIGFQQSPYEFEVGFAGLAMGIVALLATSYSADFSLAIILTSSIYRVGCGIGHIRSMIQERNFAINNTAILFINFAVPAFLLFAYYTWS